MKTNELPEGGKMKCRRCHGMMIRERIFTEQGGIPIVRCVHCGNVIDIVVVSNRRRMRNPIQMALGERRYATRLAS